MSKPPRLNKQTNKLNRQISRKKMPGSALQQRGCECSRGRRGESASSPRSRVGNFSLMRRKLSLVLFWGLTHILTFLIDQTRVHLFRYVSHFPTAPELLISCLREPSQEITGVLPQTVLFAGLLFPPRRCRALAGAGGWGRAGAPPGSALQAPPPRISPGHSGGRAPHRACLSPASFPRTSPLVCARPASREALMPRVSHFH